MRFSRADSAEATALRASHAALAPGDTPREVTAVAELFSSVFRRDVQAFLPRALVEPLEESDSHPDLAQSPFRFLSTPENRPTELELFGRKHRLVLPRGRTLHPLERRMVSAIARVLTLRYEDLFRAGQTPRLELYRGGSEDHYVAAYIEPESYQTHDAGQRRIAPTIQTLRTAALSTYENQRVSTGVLLRNDPPESLQDSASPDALLYGVELTAFKSIHRLCDGRRTLFLVDALGKLVDVIDVAHWAATHCNTTASTEIPCARVYQAHARSTSIGGHVCLVLSPNREIKLFAEGQQMFAFAHGRWRILDPTSKFAQWSHAVACPQLARCLFQAALDLAEERQGGLFVVVREPDQAIGRLIARHDLLDDHASHPSHTDLSPTEHDPLARRALHYLARGRSATDLQPSVLEALASLDGALVTDRTGLLIAFGAILSHDPASLPGMARAEGARTTAALAASLYGPVLKVSEDGIVSCYLNGSRVWDL